MVAWWCLLLLSACDCLRPMPQCAINRKFNVPPSAAYMMLYARKIIGKDNLGDPIYEDEVDKQEGINVLGKRVAVDPLTLSLLIFGIIAFNFFVLANL